MAPAPDQTNWADATLTSIVAHIQSRYHEPLRAELPRLAAMLSKVVSRHGNNLPETLLPLQQTFATLQVELLAHMVKEDRMLFPVIVALENGDPLPSGDVASWIAQPIDVMEAEHESAGAALTRIRDLTHGRGAHASLDASSSPKARADAVKCVRTWGKACFVGEGDTVTLDVSNDMLRRQVTIIGSWTFSSVGQGDCARYIADRGIDIDRLFTHRWKLEQAEEAYKLFDRQTSGKGVILPS